MRPATLAAIALAWSSYLPAIGLAADDGDNLPAKYQSVQSGVAATKTQMKAQQAKRRAQQAAAAAPEPRETKKYGSISVQGTAAFVKATTDALNLLRQTEYLSQVEDYVALIYEPSDDAGSGMYASRKAFRVGALTWKNGPVWYAGTIVHDSLHSKLYWYAWNASGRAVVPDAGVYTGAKAERKCLALQSQALRRLGADATTLEYVRKLGDDPSYADVIDRNW